MYYTVYKITNILNGMFYIGKHATEDLNDTYMGSGKFLRRAQNKYGIENFKKEILFIFDNEEEMNNKEAELVTEEFLKRPDVYNLNVGGFGGCNYVNDNGLNNKYPHERGGFVRCLKQGINPWLNWLRSLSEEEYAAHIKKRSEGIKKYLETHGSIWLGRHHSDETKRKLSIANSENHYGEANGRFNTKWVYNIELRECKVVPNDYQEDGWQDGRICGSWDFLDRHCSNCGQHLHLTSNEPKTLCDKCLEEANNHKLRERNKKKQEKIDYYTKLYEDYKQYGWEYIQKSYNLTSGKSRYWNMFKKYVPSYKPSR
jgi:hypothetical protein